MEDWQNGGFGLYFHWPFCQSKCPYCDFNSHVSDKVDQKRWESAFLSEIERVSHLAPNRNVKSIFFGGGTPSLMAPELVDAILSKVRASWPLTNDVEITLEANPTSVEAGKFKAFREAGVNRVSMGVQSLRDDHLKALGRLHSVGEAKSAFEIAKHEFERVSFDLIYARQNQSLEDWNAELTEALEMSVDHLSLYQLTIEQGTAFGNLYDSGKLRNLPTEDTATDMYFLTQELCEKYGMPSYEVSNHAKNGAESRHNLIYWAYGDYAGIGPGAHSRLTIDGTRCAIDTPLMPDAWLDQVLEKGHGEKSNDKLDRLEQATEYLLMGLRIKDGINLTRLESIAGEAFINKNKYLIEEGFIELDGPALRLTDKGRPLLNAILRELLP